MQDILVEALLSLPALVKTVVIFIASLIFSQVAAKWARRSTEKTIKVPDTQDLLARLARWSVLILGILVALEQIMDVTGFLAGLGIVGFTIGFALQDIARNFVAGLLLMIRRPFNTGDAVEVAGHAGIVMDITMRDTVIKTWDGVMEVLPNLDVYTNPIVNYSELPLRRRTINIGLGYGEDVERARQVFLEAIRNVEGVQDDPAPEILSEELGGSTLNLAARFWVNQETHNMFGVHSDAVEAVNEAAEKEGIDLPYPIQTVRLEDERPA